MTTVYRVLLRMQATKGRIIALGAIVAVVVIIGLAFGLNPPPNPQTAAYELIGIVGHTIIAPIIVLVFASAALGDPIEDGTLGYLWLRPVARWKLAVASLLSTLTITVPLVIVPMVATAALADVGATLVWATLASSAAMVVVYSSLFTLLGVVLKRALPVGLIYIFIWEAIISNVGTGPARLSVRVYARSLMVNILERTPPRFNVSTTVAVIVSAAITVVASALTAARLRNADVA